MKDYSYELLDLLKKYNNDTGAALAGESDPWCLYAFSPLRENLFEWVEIEPDARVLQIGSDYGSYTGLLAKKAAEVVVLDSRDENLEVNRIRNGACGNVRFVSQNPGGGLAAGNVSVGNTSVGSAVLGKRFLEARPPEALRAKARRFTVNISREQLPGRRPMI